MEDFGTMVQRVLDVIHTDVVFRVNFRNCAYLVIEDILGNELSDELVYAIIDAVNERLTMELRHKEAYRRQIAELHKEHGLTGKDELDRVLESGFRI